MNDSINGKLDVQHLLDCDVSVGDGPQTEHHSTGNRACQAVMSSTNNEKVFLIFFSTLAASTNLRSFFSSKRKLSRVVMSCFKRLATGSLH